MVYNDFQDIKLSALGMGCMRLPIIDKKEDQIDQEQVEKMVAYAMEKGVNYYDTAWGYHNGMSEISVGKALAAYPRDSFYLATKFPGYDLNNMSKVEEIFEKQLEKCGVDYFDFYLIHNVCEMNVNQYVDEQYGILKYLLKQKENGRIRHFGFSVHGSLEIMNQFLDVYGPYMEFGQIQLNYIDWDFQNAKDKVARLNELNIPIWVMEPLRGGKLVHLNKENTERLQALRPDESVHGWAFRYLQSIPGVTMILSGMSSFEQVSDNIQIFDTKAPLNDEEMKAIQAVADDMLNPNRIPCTECRYCVNYCPSGLDIPRLIALYNEHNFTGGGFIAPMVLGSLPKDKQPGACLGCRACESVCPQQIKVADVMADFIDKLKA